MSFNIKTAEHHRAILGLGPHFDKRQLKQAYHALAKSRHPDNFPSQSPDWYDAQEKLKPIIAANEFLRDVLESMGGSYKAPSENGPLNSAERRSAADVKPKHTYKRKTDRCGFPDSTITEVFLKSDHIISTGYDGASETLYIKFLHGDAVYRYFDVPESVFEAFLNASSHGSFANQHIYRSFRYERC